MIFQKHASHAHSNRAEPISFQRKATTHTHTKKQRTHASGDNIKDSRRFRRPARAPEELACVRVLVMAAAAPLSGVLRHTIVASVGHTLLRVCSNRPTVFLCTGFRYSIHDFTYKRLNQYIRIRVDVDASRHCHTMMPVCV